MHTPNPPLPLGYSPLAPGHIANSVTFLERTAKPVTEPRRFQPPYHLAAWADPDLALYRALFRTIGAPWLWDSHLVIDDAALAALFRDPDFQVLVLRNGDRGIGLIELDFRETGACELVYFGLAPEAIGSGLGTTLIEAAIEAAWSRPIDRFWLHTCTFDHPAALAFYQRAGFRPYAFQVEVVADPRLTGHLPRTAAPHIPLIEPATDV